jgi:hypothetical protein
LSTISLVRLLLELGIFHALREGPWMLPDELLLGGRSRDER